MKVSKRLIEAQLEFPKSEWDRRSGKSLAIILNVISTAMMNPEQKVKMYDHYKSSNNILVVNNMLRAKELIITLGLKYFYLNHNDNTITYRPFVDLDL